MEKVNLTDLKARVNIVDVIGKYLSLQKKGAEHYAMCCFHDDKRASLQVNEAKQVYKCFACGAGGDAIDFLTRKGRTMPEAIAELEGTNLNRKSEIVNRKSNDWKQVMPKDEPAFEITHYQHGKPSGVWRYTDFYGELIGFVCRFDLPEGKQVLPYTLRTDGKHLRWMWKGFDKPRPLYNQYALLNNPDAIVLLVEGEKTADAAAKIFPEFVCLTWMGGAKAYEYADWSVLKGRNVILWPDADEPGINAMKEIGKLLQPIADNVQRVLINVAIPTHWDLADCTNLEKARLYISKNSVEINLSHA